jgi:hypothetical protein
MGLSDALDRDVVLRLLIWQIAQNAHCVDRGDATGGAVSNKGGRRAALGRQVAALPIYLRSEQGGFDERRDLFATGYGWSRRGNG